MTTDEQLRLWLQGKPVHDYDIKVQGGQCCPDFSCCNGDLAPLEVRQLFVKAHKEGNSKVVNRLLGEFLAKMLAKNLPKAKVHIAGLDRRRMELDN